jgi:hypothetical protein
MQSLAINLPFISAKFQPKKWWKYLKVGRWLHSIAAVAVLLMIYFFNLAWDALASNDTPGFILFGYITLYFFTIPFFAELDAYSRFQNFKLTRDLIFRYGFQIRFVRALRHSRCQREAAFFAAKDLGYEKELSHFYRQSGYRWYHIFPDFVWSHPMYLLTKHFWYTTFCTKTYKTKYYINQ